MKTLFSLSCAFALASSLASAQTSEDALNRYLEDAQAAQQKNSASPGSLFTTSSPYSELARDPRASQPGDLITVVVVERASALTSGSTSQSRSSETQSGVSRLLGQVHPLGALPNLLGQSSDSSLDGQASTSRQTNVTATITAYVTQTMPNGNLVVEGVKEVTVNSEKQVVWLRGVVRQNDVRQDNSVTSDRIALLDLKLNGRGVVADAIRRPNAIYRLMRKVLPF